MNAEVGGGGGGWEKKGITDLPSKGNSVGFEECKFTYVRGFENNCADMKWNLLLYSQ